MRKKSEYDLYFDKRVLSANMTEFENWFAEMAQAVFGIDFELIKASGKRGDKKSDGRRLSTETIFQCYAPESPANFAKNAAAKIQDSFPDVVNLWPEMKEWVFVHNNSAGISVTASDKLEELRAQFPDLKIRTATRRFLKDQLHDKLTLQQLADVYPEAAIEVENVRMEDVRPLLRKIIKERGDHLGEENFGAIPRPDKIDHNRLSPVSKRDLLRALGHIDVVRRYLDSLSNPQNASIIQEALQERYSDLVDLGYSPDEVLGMLIESIKVDPSADQHAAALVIVAYFFDSCDIFENSPS